MRKRRAEGDGLIREGQKNTYCASASTATTGCLATSKMNFIGVGVEDVGEGSHFANISAVRKAPKNKSHLGKLLAQTGAIQPLMGRTPRIVWVAEPRLQPTGRCALSGSAHASACNVSHGRCL